MTKYSMIYLYIKTHRKTGLKYLGKTKKDPYQYEGSGTRWLRHIKKHGNDVDTKILKECIDNTEVKEWGLYYSNLWNIVKSAEWANLKPELGEGGAVKGRPGNTKGMTYEEIQNPTKALERKKKHSKMMSENNPFKDKEHTEDTKTIMQKKALQHRSSLTEDERKKIYGSQHKGKPWSDARRNAQLKKKEKV